MRTNPDTPVDPLGSIGKPIRPEAPKPVDTIKPFEAGDHSAGIGNQSKAIETMVESILPTVTDGQVEDWEGLCVTFSARTEDEIRGAADAAEFLKNLPEYGGLL